MLSAVLFSFLLPVVSGIEPFQQYFLQQFGYLPVQEEAPDAIVMKQLSEGELKSIPGSEDGDLGNIRMIDPAVVKKMQMYAAVEQTGLFDEATVKMIMTPRCQNPDIVGDPNNKISNYFLNDPQDSGRRRRNVVFSRQKRFTGRVWEQRKLTFAFENTTPQNSKTKDIIESSFAAWAECSELSFSMVDDLETADIRIKFAAGDHPPPSGDKFDGTGGILAHAWYPPLGLAHFDEDENWADDCFLFSVALHEIGHLLGLDHSIKRESIMFAYFDPEETQCGASNTRELHESDIKRIIELYGAEPCSRTAEWTEEPTEYGPDELENIGDLTSTGSTSSPTPSLSKSGSMIPPATDAGFDKNWQIKCGAITDNVLNSPNYPAIYPNDAVCHWNVSTPTEQNTIELHLFEFHLEDEQNGECIFDYLKLTYDEGVGVKTPKTVMFCGKKSGSIKLDTRAVDIEFVSDNLKQYKGFKILFTFPEPPRCEALFDESRGVITFPASYPMTSADPVECTYTITADSPNKKILIVIDVLAVVDGVCDSNQFKLIENQDNETPSESYVDVCSDNNRYKHFISTTSSLQVVFKDFQDTGLKFRIRYYSIGENDCSETISGKGKWSTPSIGSGRSSTYPPNTDCLIYIDNPQKEPLFVDFSGNISLEYDKSCSYDFLEIFSMERGIERLCGNMTMDIFKYESNILLYFHSDNSVQWKGFQIDVNPILCDEELTSPHGRITSLNYPTMYPSDMRCRYTFASETLYFICFEGRFDVRGRGPHYDRDSCPKDYLAAATQHPHNEEYKPFCKKPGPMVLQANYGLTFVSNNDNDVGSGFSFNYTALSSTTRGCYRLLTKRDARKNIQLSGSGDMEQTCVWEIQTDTRYAIEIEVRRLKFKKNCDEEYIEIYGKTCDYPKERLCNQAKQKHRDPYKERHLGKMSKITINGRRALLLIRFKSKYSQVQIKFRLTEPLDFVSSSSSSSPTMTSSSTSLYHDERFDYQ